MATKTIAWTSGGGYITLTYTGVGNAPISVKSDANNLFEDREQTVRIVTTGGSPEQAVELLVRQKGKTYPAGTVFNFDYTGSVQQVTLPEGRYKLQCWGAQGGNVSGNYPAAGSKGGYSEGVLTLKKPTTIYIFVGGKGADSPASSVSGTADGGWNGGGSSVRQASYNSGGTNGISYPRPGGGGTDMCIVPSTMNYSSGRTNRSSTSLLSRFIVAGGGAGASARHTEVVTEFEPALVEESVGVTLEQGTWRESIGSRDEGPNYYRIRSNNALYVNPGELYNVSVNSGYQVFLIFFSDFVSNAVGYTGNTVALYYSWAGSYEMIYTYSRMAVVVKKTDGSIISPGDNHGLQIRRSYYTESPSTSVQSVPKTVEPGTWSENDGSRCSDKGAPAYTGLRLRTDDAIQLAKGNKYRVSVNSGYQVFVIFFSNFVTNALDDFRNTVGGYISWQQSVDFFAFYADMAVIIRKPDNSPITTSADHGLTITRYAPDADIEESSGSSDSRQQGGGTIGKGQHPGTQSSAGDGGDFGLGANQGTTNYRYAAGAGGGGWYGGGTGYSDTATSYVNSSGGGSGFVNTAANAGYRPGGYTGLPLDSGSTEDGATMFPSPSGANETGHAGNGYARITVLE